MPLKYYAEPQGKTVSRPCPASGVELETFIPWTLVKRGVKKEIITPTDTPDAFIVEAAEERQRKTAGQPSPVVRALGLAYYWQSLLDEGKFASLTEIAQAEGLSKGHVNRLAQLCRLSPERVRRCLEGERSLTLENLTKQAMSVDWNEHGPPYCDRTAD